MAAKYSAASRRISDEQAQVYGRALKKMERAGPLTPKRIEYEARHKSNPLHDWFDWDDESAGYKYRLWQARDLIRIILVDTEEIEDTTRAFVSIVTPDGDREYRTTRVVMQDVDLRAQVIDEILGRIRYWKRTHKSLKELAEVLDQMEKKVRKLKK